MPASASPKLPLLAACSRLWAWVCDQDTRFAGERDPLGLEGERLAAAFLKRSGYRIVSRNLVAPMGELDILAIEPDKCTIVAVEVKARRIGPAAATPPPEAAITAHKRRKLVTVVDHLTRANGWNPTLVRIDVVAVEIGSAGSPPTIRHWPGVIRVERGA